jgi:tripartite ATP-independent transporter DctM subunit
MVKNDAGMEVMKKMGRAAYRREFKEKFTSFVPAIFFPVIILGGIYSGIMTPTESASVSLVYALLIGFLIYHSLNFQMIKEVMLSSASTIGVIMIMLFTVMMLSRIYITENVHMLILNALLAISTNKHIILLIVNIFMIILGMLMDDTSATLLAVPVLLPIIKSVGVDPIHFAAIVAVNISLGCITPPCAPLLYFAARLSNTDVAEMLKPTMILILFVWIPTLILVTYVPAISLFFPSLLLK